MAEQDLDETYFSRCAGCQRQDTAKTFGRIAAWHKLGMIQEEEVTK